MEDHPRTSKGFIVTRRCEGCGKKLELLEDAGEACILVCPQCGKQYKFRCKAV